MNTLYTPLFTLPNILSISRIILSPLIFFIKDNKCVLFSFLLIIGLTDILDGYFARKYKKETKFGAKIDGIADIVFFNLLVLYSIIFEIDIIIRLKYFILIIILLKLFIFILGIIKYKKSGFLHTIGNKISGVIIFIGICFFILTRNSLLLNIGVIISIISSLEELIIIIIGREYNENIKGIWEINKKEIIICEY